MTETGASDVSIGDVFKASQNRPFRSRTYHEHGVIVRYVGRRVDVTKARILDFGCGALALASASFAARYRDSEVVGSDIVPASRTALSRLLRNEANIDIPTNLTLLQNAPSSLPDSMGKFDLIYSWSVFEHIPASEIEACFSAIRSRLAPDGVFFFQIGGLYFSHNGGHLPTKEPWAHLRLSVDEIHKSVFATDRPPEVREREWRQFVELNRLLGPDFIEMAKKSGLKLTTHEFLSSEHEPPEDLLRIYTRDALMTHEVRAVFRRA